MVGKNIILIWFVSVVVVLFFFSTRLLLARVGWDVCEWGSECVSPEDPDDPFCYEEYCGEAEDCTAGCYTVYEDCDDDPYTPLDAYKRCVYTQDNPDQDGYQCTDWCEWEVCTWDEMGQDYFQVRFCCDCVNTDEMQIRLCNPTEGPIPTAGPGGPSCQVGLSPVCHSERSAAE